jgi:DNA polymerase-3 subunit epsilon
MTTDWRAIRRFVALDFETADHHPDSACAIGAVRIEDRGIVARFEALVRPPRKKVHFTFVHGLTWQELEGAAPFAGAWPRCAPLFDGVEAIVAHGASFDRAVLLTCCAHASLRPPRAPFLCTRELAARTLKLATPSLADACRLVDVPLLRPHDALADAEACGQLFLALQTHGQR